MNSKSKHIFFYLAKMPVMLLYLCFFTVQLLSFNSDNNNKTQSTSWYNNGVIKTNASASGNTGKANTNKQSNINIRLNKRFQPEKAICCNNVFIITASSFRLIEKSRKVYNSKFIPAGSFTTHLLRGPPIVA